MAVQGAIASRSGLRSALPLLAPAYLWLTVAIFLPLSAMVFFSFMTDLPLSGKPWAFTLGNYAAFFSQSLYLTLLLASLRLGLEVTLWCIVIGYPAAYVLAKVLKGRSREAIFLLVILPFWSNGLVRIFSWAMVLREGGILDTALNAVLPFKINIDLMYSYPAVIIGLVHSYVPYMVLTCYLTLQAIDDSLIEAGALARRLAAAGAEAGDHPAVDAGAGRGRGADLRAGRRLLHGAAHPRRPHRHLLRHGHRGPVRRRLQLAAGCGSVLHPAGRRAGHPGGCLAGAEEGCVMATTRILEWLGRLYIWLLLAFLYLPIIIMALMSFNVSPFYQLPFEWTTEWYASLWQNDQLIAATWNSLEIAIITTIICVVLGIGGVAGAFPL